METMRSVAVSGMRAVSAVLERGRGMPWSWRGRARRPPPVWRRIGASIASLTVAGAATAAPPPDAATLHARTLAASCTACHAVGGPPDDARLHPLDGLSEATLLAALRAYRASDRTGDVMVQLAKGYSDAQLVQIAGVLAAGAASKGSP